MDERVSISRRTVLAGLAGAAVAPLLHSTPSHAVPRRSATGALLAESKFDLRVTRRRSDGERRFFHRAAGSSTWLELGTAATLAAGSAIFAGAWPVSIGAMTTSSGQPFAGRVDRLEIRDGIDGQVVASPDFTVLSAGQRQFFDDQGNLWMVEGTASISS